MKESQVCSLDQEDPLEKGMATHYSVLAWSIPYIYSMYIYTHTYVISQQPKNNQSDNWRKRKL